MIPKPYNIQLIVKVIHDNPDSNYSVNTAKLSIPVDIETKYGIQLAYDNQRQVDTFLEGVLGKTINKYKKDLEEEATRNTPIEVPAPTIDPDDISF